MYSNLVSSAAGFAHITPVIRDLTKIEFLWPCSEYRGKDLDQRSVDNYWWHIWEACTWIWELLGLFFVQSVQLSGCLEEKLNSLAFFPLRRVRAWAALYWSMLETYQRCLYSNLWCFGVGFSPFSLVLSLPKQKQIPLAYFPARRGIAWAALYWSLFATYQTSLFSNLWHFGF